MLDITCRHGSDDAALFTRIVNQGIDSRLEGFTRSRFYTSAERLCLDFDDSEVSILLRRLSEDDNEEAQSWESDIVFVQYGVEV